MSAVTVTVESITDIDPCEYCSSPERDQHVICVVEEPQNVSGIEKTGDFRGVYHVLMGAISPLQGIGPDELKIKGLLARIAGGGWWATTPALPSRCARRWRRRCCRRKRSRSC